MRRLALLVGMAVVLLAQPIHVDDAARVIYAAYTCGRLDGMRQALEHIGGYADKIKILDSLRVDGKCADIDTLIARWKEITK